jgi:hypothetical protein
MLVMPGMHAGRPSARSQKQMHVGGARRWGICIRPAAIAACWLMPSAAAMQPPAKLRLVMLARSVQSCQDAARSSQPLSSRPVMFCWQGLFSARMTAARLQLLSRSTSCSLILTAAPVPEHDIFTLGRACAPPEGLKMGTPATCTNQVVSPWTERAPGAGASTAVLGSTARSARACMQHSVAHLQSGGLEGCRTAGRKGAPRQHAQSGIGATFLL